MTTKTTRRVLVALRPQDLPDGTHVERGDEVDPELFDRGGNMYRHRDEHIQMWVTWGYVAWEER